MTLLLIALLSVTLGAQGMKHFPDNTVASVVCSTGEFDAAGAIKPNAQPDCKSYCENNCQPETTQSNKPACLQGADDYAGCYYQMDWASKWSGSIIAGTAANINNVTFTDDFSQSIRRPSGIPKAVLTLPVADGATVPDSVFVSIQMATSTNSIAPKSIIVTKSADSKSINVDIAPVMNSSFVVEESVKGFIVSLDFTVNSPLQTEGGAAALDLHEQWYYDWVSAAQCITSDAQHSCQDCLAVSGCHWCMFADISTNMEYMVCGIPPQVCSDGLTEPVLTPYLDDCDAQPPFTAAAAALPNVYGSQLLCIAIVSALYRFI